MRIPSRWFTSLAFVLSTFCAAPVSAQDAPATVRLTVLVEAAPVEGATARVADLTPLVAARTDAAGLAALRMPAGARRIHITRLGMRADSVSLTLRAGQDTSIVVQLTSTAGELDDFVVSATRGERRVEDSPLRVEVVDEEEIAEKVAMRPASIQMLLAETGGLRVQTTSPSIGAANVRVQGLRGRYTLLLTDGLPLAGEGGGFSLLQTPIDLARVEVLKGSTGLYGGGLGGVINMVAKRPGAEAEHTALVNQTSRGGTDGLVFLTAPVSSRVGYTLLAGAHRQSRVDADGDGWSDLAGFERTAVRPRLYYDDGAGRTAFLTSGYTAEDRTGGTMRAGAMPGGGTGTFAEGLRTRRADAGALARWVSSESAPLLGIGALHGAILTVRGSIADQQHRHQFGEYATENDRHRTWFGEAAVAVPRGPITYVVGGALQQDRYRNADVPAWDYTYALGSAFVQADVDATSWLLLSSSARVDAHRVFGTFVHPRLSVLLRRPAEGAFAGWTTRLSGGTGMFAPTPISEEVEAVGLTPLVQTTQGGGVFVVERARSASLDVGGPMETALGRMEFNATGFASRIAQPVQLYDMPSFGANGVRHIALANAPEPTRTWGAELLARVVRELGDERADGEEAPALRVTATYAYLRSTECDPSETLALSCGRRDVPLTPRHAATLVASVEQEGVSRVGLEVYYTGTQALDNNPYRSTSKPYVLVGLLGERAFTTRLGKARLFVNLEDLTNVRQTKWDPLVLPSRGSGGRWTTPAWTELVGFTVNGGVRLGF